MALIDSKLINQAYRERVQQLALHAEMAINVDNAIEAFDLAQQQLPHMHSELEAHKAALTKVATWLYGGKR